MVEQVVQQELRIQFMEANIVIKGIEKVIERDLEKHKILLDRSKLEMLSFKKAVSHEIKKKKYYKSLIGDSKFDDVALNESMGMIAVNIRHLSDSVKVSQDSIDHHALIVDDLTQQLEDQYKGLKVLSDYHKEHNADSN